MSSPQKADGRLSTVMQEERVFPPPAEFSAKARIGSLEDYRRLYDEAKADPDGFWDARAKMLPWMAPYSQVLDWQPPFARWLGQAKNMASPQGSTPLRSICAASGGTRA